MSRTNFNGQFKCADCGTTLVISDNYRAEGHSAYDVTIVLRVKPCPLCVKSHKEPIDAIKRALGIKRTADDCGLTAGELVGDDT